MTLLKAVVREVTLDGSALSEEAFLAEGVGSAFVSRPNVLVVVTATERGVAQLPKKFEQLIGRGFHHVVLMLPGLDRVSSEGWGHLKGALAYADQFAGWVILCGISPTLRSAIEAAARKDGADDIVRFARDRDDALAAFQRLQQEDAVDPLAVESGDGLTGSGDTTSSADDDWGGDWGSSDTTTKDSGRLPRVDAVEMLVEADELGALRDRVQTAIKKGKKYFTLRLHFRRDRRVTTEDMRALAGARDIAAKAGGQVVLAALQEELSKWLRLLGEDRNFTIAETADEAERLHRRHAAGELPAAAPPRDGEPAFVVMSKDARAIVIRPSAARAKATVKPTVAALRVVVLGREGLSSLGVRVKRLAADGVHDVVADLSKFKEIRGESFDPLPRALELAQKLGVRLAFGGVAREVRALLKILGVPDGGEAGRSAIAESTEGAALLLAAARPAFEELRLDVTTEQLDEAPPLDPVSSVDLDEPALDEIAPPRAAQSQAELAALRAELAAAQSAAQRAGTERDQAKRKAQEAEAERDQARRRAQEGEQQKERADRAEKKADELQKKLEDAQKKATEAQKKLDDAQKKLDDAQRELEARRTRIAELELALQQGDAQVDEVKQGADGKVRELELELEGLRDRAMELEAEALRAKQVDKALAERDARVAALEARERELGAAVEQAKAAQRDQGARAASDATARVRELEAALADRDGQVKALQAEVVRARATAAPAAASTATAGGDEALRRRVAELERENAQVLTEAEQEIQRLMREQKLLREELESAGEMIERLGKELEYS